MSGNVLGAFNPYNTPGDSLVMFIYMWEWVTRLKLCHTTFPLLSLWESPPGLRV